MSANVLQSGTTEQHHLRKNLIMGGDIYNTETKTKPSQINKKMNNNFFNRWQTYFQTVVDVQERLRLVDRRRFSRLSRSQAFTQIIIEILLRTYIIRKWIPTSALGSISST